MKKLVMTIALCAMAHGAWADGVNDAYLREAHEQDMANILNDYRQIMLWITRVDIEKQRLQDAEEARKRAVGQIR